jgi:3-oxoacyl-[acyl-carrier-protein] synthase III
VKKRADIRAIAYYLPEGAVTNEMLSNEHPDWDMRRVLARTGVATRHVAQPDQTAFDLACRACDLLFQDQPLARERIDAILFCTQSADYLLPSNSTLLHGYLDLEEDVFALDFSLACSGFVYGLALAQSLIVSGIATDVLLVTADTYTKYIHPGDRSARTLFGDGAAATWISVSNSDRGVLDVQCATSGKDHGMFVIPAGGCRLPRSAQTSVAKADLTGNVRSPENIHMDGSGILSFVESVVPRQVTDVLARNQLTMADIDLVILHQASKVTMESLCRILGIPGDKTFSNLRDIGNTVSASIPIALRDAMDQGRTHPEQRILLCGFGVGMSWATAILQT